MPPKRPVCKFKHLSYETKADGRQGWKVQYGGKQHTTLAKLKDAKDCLHRLLVKKGIIGVGDPLPLRAKFRKKATKPSATVGVTLERRRGMYRGTAVSVG